MLLLLLLLVKVLTVKGEMATKVLIVKRGNDIKRLIVKGEMTAKG